MGCHGIEAQLQMFHIVRSVMFLQDRIGNRALFRLFFCYVLSCQSDKLFGFLFRHQFCTVYQESTSIIQFNHMLSFLSLFVRCCFTNVFERRTHDLSIIHLILDIVRQPACHTCADEERRVHIFRYL